MVFWVLWSFVELREGERKRLFHIHSFSNEKKVQRVLKKYPCFFLFVFVVVREGGGEEKEN